MLFDGSAGLDAASKNQLDARSILVMNKADLPHQAEEGAIAISTQTGQGVDALLAQLTAQVVEFFAGESAPMITRNRHRALLSEALGHLNRFNMALPLELACEELRRCAVSIGKITGKIEVDDVLDVVFREFCIGK